MVFALGIEESDAGQVPAVATIYHWYAYVPEPPIAWAVNVGRGIDISPQKILKGPLQASVIALNGVGALAVSTGLTVADPKFEDIV
jgi:hypothetical protein